LLGRLLLAEIARQQMGNDLGIGLGFEPMAERAQFAAQLIEVLDDAVMDDGDAVGGVRMGVGFARAAVGGPAGVADADRACQRLARPQRPPPAAASVRPPPRALAALPPG